MGGTYTCEKCGYQSPDVGDYDFRDGGTVSVCTSCSRHPKRPNLCAHDEGLDLEQVETYLYHSVTLHDGTMVVVESKNSVIETGYRKLTCQLCAATVEIPEEEEWV